ncbi:MAG: apolipoprotein N-acyltransferase [Ancrocorticia sp.]
MTKPHLLTSYFMAIGAGMALWAAFPPVGWWPMAILGIALLVGVLQGRTWLASLWWGLVAGTAFFFPMFDWARVASGVVIAQVALAVLQALFIALTAVLWQGLMRGPLGKRTLARTVSMAAIWVAVEQLRSVVPFGGMPWGTLAFSQVDGPLVRLAPWGSVQLVGFILVLVGVLAHHAFASLRRERIGSTFIALAIGGAALFSPAFLPLASTPEDYLKIGFAQGIVPRKGELMPGQSQALTVTSNLVKASRQLPSDVDVVFWPESSSDRDPREDASAHSLISEASEFLGVPLVLGTQSYPGENRYNEYVVWMPGEGIIDSYSKQHPVPFGEYMPYRDFFRQFTTAVDLVSVNMLPGHEPAVLDVPLGGTTVRIAVPICFEVAESRLVAEAIRQGSGLLIVPTNNASFGTTAESRQQFDMTRFRAIEHGRAAIQVSTVGVSGIVEPNGFVHEMTEPWTEDARTARVGLRTEQTFATRSSDILYGGVFGVGALLTAVALCQLWQHRHARAKGSK